MKKSTIITIVLLVAVLGLLTLFARGNILSVVNMGSGVYFINLDTVYSPDNTSLVVSMEMTAGRDYGAEAFFVLDINDTWYGVSAPFVNTRGTYKQVITIPFSELPAGFTDVKMYHMSQRSSGDGTTDSKCWVQGINGLERKYYNDNALDYRLGFYKLVFQTDNDLKGYVDGVQYGASCDEPFMANLRWNAPVKYLSKDQIYTQHPFLGSRSNETYADVFDKTVSTTNGFAVLTNRVYVPEVVGEPVVVPFDWATYLPYVVAVILIIVSVLFLLAGKGKRK